MRGSKTSDHFSPNLAADNRRLRKLSIQNAEIPSEQKTQSFLYERHVQTRGHEQQRCKFETFDTLRSNI